MQYLQDRLHLVSLKCIIYNKPINLLNFPKKNSKHNHIAFPCNEVVLLTADWIGWGYIEHVQVMINTIQQLIITPPKKRAKSPRNSRNEVHCGVTLSDVTSSERNRRSHI